MNSRETMPPPDTANFATLVGPPDCRPFIKPLAGIIKQAPLATRIFPEWRGAS